MSYTKIKITGTIKLKSGLHIGGDDSFSAIGAVDLPVVRDPLSHQPIIPGSTLKGKLRSLLARDKDTIPASGTAGFKNDCDEVKRLFGSAPEGGGGEDTDKKIQMSRLQFSDCFLANKDKLPQIFEVKFENTIDRLSGIANPRQIERVVRGAEFGMEIIYNVEDSTQVKEDFDNLRTAFTLLENDYLGGGGTRGSGRVSIGDLKAAVVTGDRPFAVPELA